MSDPAIGLLSVVAILALIQSGVPIAVALIATAFAGAWAITGSVNIAGNLVVMAAAHSISSYTYGVIPLFMLMGLLISVSEVGRDTFAVAQQVFRRLKGGVGMATVAANAVFAAVTGTSIASAAVFTRVAVPEMVRLGYTRRFAVGVVAGSSVLGMLIPPSLLMIIFGIITEVSIGDLFTAGIIPGLVLAAAYIVLIAGLVTLWPSFVGRGGVEPSAAGGEEPLMPVSELLAKSLPIVALVLLILGGIYGGIFTPTEAGAAGAGGALLIALVKGRLDWHRLWTVLSEAGYVTAAISIVLIGAHMYSRMLATSGLPTAMGKWAVGSGFSLPVIIALYLAAILLLGTILDAVAILLILVPLVLPTLAANEVDLVWFGVISVIAVEIGLLTPPLGLSCFVVKANVNDPSVRLGDIFAGAFPFAVTMVVVLALVYLCPVLATALL